MSGAPDVKARAVVTNRRGSEGSSLNLTLDAFDAGLAAEIVGAIQGGWTVTIEPDPRGVKVP